MSERPSLSSPHEMAPRYDTFSDPDLAFQWCDERLMRIMDDADVERWWQTVHPQFGVTPFSLFRHDPQRAIEYIATLRHQESFAHDYEV